MKQFIVKVTQVVPDDQLDLDDLQDKDVIVGSRSYEARDSEHALDQFHASVAIGCLDDFNIEVEEAK